VEREVKEEQIEIKINIMETYFIKIDINSIKLNENGGQNQTTVPRGKIVSFKSKFLFEDFIDGENCVIISWKEKEGEMVDIEGHIHSEELLEKCMKEKRENIEINIQYLNTHFNHLPVPTYSFEYENTKVTCDNCKEEITIKDLEYAESPDGEYISERVCPRCGTVDCCELEFEKIEDAIERKGKE
jgi:hypothetical protein